MSHRVYSRRSKSILEITAELMVMSIIDRIESRKRLYSSQSQDYSNSVQQSYKTPEIKPYTDSNVKSDKKALTSKSKKVNSKIEDKYNKPKSNDKKPKEKNKQVSKDISQTLEMIEKQLEKYGLSKEEIKEEVELIDEDEVEEQIISVQEQVCETIKNKVSNNTTMKIENEEVLEDNSVVITISL